MNVVIQLAAGQTGQVLRIPEAGTSPAWVAQPKAEVLEVLAKRHKLHYWQQPQACLEGLGDAPDGTLAKWPTIA